MAAFSQASLAKLATCDPRLQQLANEVVKIFDCTVVCGFRNQADQDEAVRTGRSKTPWPTSKHNSMPSHAVDLAPVYADEIPWNDSKRFILFAGFVLGVASSLGIRVRWGGDWNGDRIFNETFQDLPHFELAE